MRLQHCITDIEFKNVSCFMTVVATFITLCLHKLL